jgi:iron-sulfur cluster repair protein YtfE (RIC family)
MEAIRILGQDHALLRKKLALLKSALQVAPEARFVVREMCFSLQRVLQEHMQREQDVFERSSHEQPSEAPPSKMADHSAVQHLLRTVNELLLGGMRASMPTVVVRLAQAIEQLEAQMDEQERTVFAALDEATAARGHDLPTAISGAMSVNEIVQRYPRTERIFEQLRIDRFREGYESVDELAWRYGMDVSQFLEQLRQVATSFPL